MTKLINCIECNGKISSKAYGCTHCKTEYPHGIYCIICNQIMKQSETQQMFGVRISAHHRCYETIVSDTTIVCPACHYQVNDSSVYQCPECGHPFRFLKCCYCKLDVYEGKAKKLKEYDLMVVRTLCMLIRCVPFRIKINDSPPVPFATLLHKNF